MKQPDIGLKVAEMRQQKGFTQEQLAEYCDVSPRTIQRIESGEVEPRAFTRNNLSNALDFDFGLDNVKNETLWLAALHLSSTICNIIIPLIIWSWKKNQSYKLDKHGRDVLNFQITINLALFACLFLLFAFASTYLILPDLGSQIEFVRIIMLICVPLPLVLIGFFVWYQGIANTIRVLNDKPYKYPLSIQFIK
jgi:uncharacterized Tic20 family protein